MQIYIGIITLIPLHPQQFSGLKTTMDVRKCNINRTDIVLNTKINLISVECGVGYQIPQSTNPCQTLSRHTPPFHDLICNPKCIEPVCLCIDTI